MSEFISRKQLEVHGDTYPVRQRLRELGCEWDAAARAWIAPSLEVKELCDEVVSNQIRSPHWLREEIDYSSSEFQDFMDRLECDNLPSPGPVILANPIAYTPTKDDAERICGSGNILRYWNDEIPAIAAELLASGEQNWQEIYERMENKGWRNRSTSIVRDIVAYYRQYPPIPAVDEVTVPVAIAPEAIDPEGMNGSISVLVDASRDPLAFKVEFPYSARKVNMIKWLPGRKWHPDRKYWEVPLDARHGSQSVFDIFPHFKRSPRALEIERELTSGE